MTRTVLKGLNGSNPLGFMAAVGLLRVLEQDGEGPAHLGFEEDGTFHAWVDSRDGRDLAGLVEADAVAAGTSHPWRLEYEKAEKKGIKVVADLKAPPDTFNAFLQLAIREWSAGIVERADYAAAYATDIAVDGKGNTKPTAFHFTAANQQFLGTVERTRSLVTREWVARALHEPGHALPGANVRWDPDSERSRALMGVDPTDQGTVVNAPLEWLAFRALPALPCLPVGTRVVTTGVTGRRQDEMRFHWPLWSSGASYATVRSLLGLSADWIASLEGRGSVEGARERGVFALCTSEIRRSGQGFGNFGPALVRT